jgi:hypothetical protein
MRSSARAAGHWWSQVHVSPWRGSGKRVRACATLLLLLAGAGGLARADFPSDVPDRFKMQAGGVDASFDTQGSLSLSDGPAGLFINFEDVFDLPISKQFWYTEGFYRFSEKGYVDFGYVDFYRKARNVIEEDVDWGNVTFQANATIDAEFGSAFIYAAYRHDFLRLDQVHISGSVGLSYLDLTTGLSANGGVIDENGNPITGEYERKVEVKFPVPLFGLQLDWRITKHTAIQMYLRTLRIDYNGIKGGIGQRAIRYEWYATRHFAIGGGWSEYSIDLDRYETGDYTARFNYEVSGLELYLKMAF